MKVKNKLVPAALVASLTGFGAVTALERLEGNMLSVYSDSIANGLPTRCAGDTNHTQAIGDKLTSDECNVINRATMIKYGASVLACTNWDNLDGDRLVGLTLFAINVGKKGACNSQSFSAINAGRISEGCNLLASRPDGSPNWSAVRGRYVQGLQNRRIAEREWCRRGLAQ